MQNLRQARIAIVGPGAVGSYYGGLLACAGYDVHFLLRSDFDAVRELGLTIRTGGRTLQHRVKAARSAAEIGPCDLVIIALKATANAALEEIIPPLLQPGTALLTLQNGLGNEEFLAERWGAARVLGGLCFVCLNRVAPGVVEHYDHGTLSLGEFQRPPSERVQAIAAAFNEVGVETKVVENLVTERWRKLVWNVPFNGIAITAGDANVADILADEGLRTNARELMTEILAAAAVLGHEIPASFADFQIERSESMGPYKPSSLIDFQARRPVEVEAIWGEPWRQGTAAGVRLVRLGFLYRLLLHLTK